MTFSHTRSRASLFSPSSFQAYTKIYIFYCQHCFKCFICVTTFLTGHATHFFSSEFIKFGIIIASLSGPRKYCYNYCQAWGTDHVQLITKENYNEHCAALMAQTSVIYHILITYNLQLYIHISYNAHMFINNLHCIVSGLYGMF